MLRENMSVTEKDGAVLYRSHDTVCLAFQPINRTTKYFLSASVTQQPDPGSVSTGTATCSRRSLGNPFHFSTAD
jgi:hypothetical protein